MKKYLLSELSTKKIAGIYKINFPNGKIYIGQSQNIYKRILEHNSYARAGHGNHKLQLCELAIKKYGQIQEVEILEEVIDLTLLDKLETYYINLYDSTNKEKGYNIVQEGDAAGKRGCDNINSNFTPEQLEEIIYLLQNNLKMSYKDIAEKFNVSSDCIYKICAGITQCNPNLVYPLRKSYCHDHAKKDSVLDYFKSEEELLKFKDDLKYLWELDLENELPNKYSIPRAIAIDINHGRLFAEYGNQTYPIRGKNLRNNFKLTIDNVKDILNQLRTTKDSMTKIGEPQGMKRRAIANLNIGQTYPIKNYDYPARKTKM